jgi:hypothetical protein
MLASTPGLLQSFPYFLCGGKESKCLPRTGANANRPLRNQGKAKEARPRKDQPHRQPNEQAPSRQKFQSKKPTAATQQPNNQAAAKAQKKPSPVPKKPPHDSTSQAQH